MKLELQKSKRRYEEIDTLITNIVEGGVIKGLSEARCNQLLEKYEKEEIELKVTISKLEEKITTLNAENFKSKSFLALAKSYTDFSELTTQMLNEFIERVEVYEKESNTQRATQRIDIKFRFIGNFQVPSNIISPAEIKEQERLKRELEEKEERAKEVLRLSRERAKSKQQELSKRLLEGTATEEELKKHAEKKKRCREYDKKRKENGFRRKKSLNAYAKLRNKIKEEIPLTDEEQEKYSEYKRRLAESQRKFRAKQKEKMPPSPPKILSIKKIREKKNNGLPLTYEEQEKYLKELERKRKYERMQREERKLETGITSSKTTWLQSVREKIKEGLPLTDEELERYNNHLEKKRASWKEYSQRKKLETEKLAS